MREGLESDVERLETTFLALRLPDGTPVLNRIMRVMLARKLERPIDAATFFRRAMRCWRRAVSDARVGRAARS